MIRVCLVGLGKTGREIARVLLEQEDIKLVAAVCSPGSVKEGRDVGEVIGCGSTGILISTSENLEQLIFKTKPDVVVDFSSPEATIKNSRIFSKMRVNILVCTTGFTKFALKRLFVLSRKYHNGMAYAPNITLGVNVLMLLTNLAATILNDYDFHITEIHHNKKKDSPSGTAIKIAREVEKGLKSAGVERNESNIPISAIRAGGVVGKHAIIIVGEEDKIEISHESFSRRAFAEGAIRAIRFLYKKSGYFEMNEILNLSKVLGDYLEKENNRIGRRYSHFGEEVEKSKESLA